MRETKAWRYAIGMLGTSIPINMFVPFMAVFYVRDLGVLTAVQVGSVLVAYSIIDAIDNPVYGYLSDRTRSRFGRRRPWLFVGAPLLGLSLVAFFSPPGDLSATGYLLWFAVTAVLVETTDSLVNTNYGSLLPELFPEEKRRARVNALRQGLGLLGLAIALSLTPILKSVLGYGGTAALYAVIAVVAIVVMATGVRENPDRLVSPQPGVVDSVRSVLGTPSFWVIAITNGAYASAVALLLAGAPFFMTYTLGLPDSQVSVLLGTVILTSIGFLALWSALVRRRGALAVWRTALVVFAVSFIPMYFASSLLAAVAAGVLIGLGFSGVIATTDVVVARFIDADAARTGRHREAMVIAAFGFFNRLSTSVKSLGFFGMTFLFGYVNRDETGDQPENAARFLMIVMPFVLATIAAIVARFVRIEVEPGPDDATAAGAVPVPRRPAA